jgi:hypothetical protein
VRADLRLLASRKWTQEVSIENLMSSMRWGLNRALDEMSFFLKDLWL